MTFYPLTAWNIYDGGTLIDTVFFSPRMTRDEVRRSLVDRDHLPATIRVARNQTYARCARKLGKMRQGANQ